MFLATCSDPDRSSHVPNAATKATATPVAASRSGCRALCRFATIRRITIAASTTTAVNAHPPNATPSVETPAAATSANGKALRGGPRSQRECRVTSAPSVKIIGSAVISLTDAISS